MDAYLDTAAVQGRECIKARHPGYHDIVGRSVQDMHAGGCGWYSCREKPRAVSWRPKHRRGRSGFPLAAPGAQTDCV